MKEDERILGELEGANLHVKEIALQVIEVAWTQKRVYRCVWCKKKIRTQDFSCFEDYEKAITDHSTACVEKRFERFEPKRKVR